MDLFDINVITGSLPEFWRGLWMTLKLTFISLAIGFTLAIPLAVARVSKNAWIRRPVFAYTYFFRGTPMLVQLLLIYYGVSQWEWIRLQWEAGHPVWLLFREAYFCALFAFTLNTCAYTVEIIAGSIRNTPHGEVEAAKAMGMTRFTALRRIILPSALRRAIPGYSNEVILMLHSTTVAFTATIPDILKVARDANSATFMTFQSFGIAALIYLTVTFALVGLFRLAERRWLAFLGPSH